MRQVFQLAIALTAVCVIAVQSSAAVKPGKQKKNKPVQGSITTVEKETLTVSVVARKKDDAEPVEKKFKLDSGTTYDRVVKVKGQKGQLEVQPAKFEDLKAGENVSIQLKGDTVDKVTILVKNKKKT